jgi:hypothetical protein
MYRISGHVLTSQRPHTLCLVNPPSPKLKEATKLVLLKHSTIPLDTIFPVSPSRPLTHHSMHHLHSPRLPSHFFITHGITNYRLAEMLSSRVSLSPISLINPSLTMTQASTIHRNTRLYFSENFHITYPPNPKSSQLPIPP